MKRCNKKLLLLALGGTIACVKTKMGFQPKLKAAKLISYISLPSGVEVECKDFLKRTVVFPKDWIALSWEIFNRFGYYDGFVITLGTDTLAYLAAALSLMLGNVSKPVVLTGAMHPISNHKGDGRSNLYNAILTATQPGVKGILTVFNRKVLAGDCISKVRSEGINAFESINVPPLGIISAGKIRWNKSLAHSAGRLMIKTSIDSRVSLVKLTPNIQSEFFNNFKKYRGIVIEGYGDGNVSSNLIPILKRLAKTKLIVLTSQCTYGKVSHKYEGGVVLIRHGVISAGSMTKEMTLVKAMWALGQSKNNAEAARIFIACTEY